MRTNQNVATAAEMRVLVENEIIKPYNVGANWTSYSGAPFDCHIRWNSQGWGFILGTEWERDVIREWVEDELDLISA